MREVNKLMSVRHCVSLKVSKTKRALYFYVGDRKISGFIAEEEEEEEALWSRCRFIVTFLFLNIDPVASPVLPSSISNHNTIKETI